MHKVLGYFFKARNETISGALKQYGLDTSTLNLDKTPGNAQLDFSELMRSGHYSKKTKIRIFEVCVREIFYEESETKS